MTKKFFFENLDGIEYFLISNYLSLHELFFKLRTSCSWMRICSRVALLSRGRILMPSQKQKGRGSAYNCHCAVFWAPSHTL